MADSEIRRTGADPNLTADSRSTAQSINPGPYIAEVVKHVTGTRMGQIKVWISDRGGEKTDVDSLPTATYVSPFYGYTFGTNDQTETPGAWTSGMSYGMYMVPPDVGTKVLVVYAGGDPNRCYWLGCVIDGPSHHMVPGMSRHIGGASLTQLDSSASGKLSSQVVNTSVLPVVEYSTGLSGAFNTDALTNTPRYAHPYQSAVLVNQGLDTDPVRGAISSSSQREAPSNVYGISTPGRSATGNNPQITSSVAALGDFSQQAVIGRLGGHQFVMDDGDVNGVDQLIRLRTASGHQILMNDTEGILYIGSSTGYQWLEFSKSGMINIYGAAGINMRTQGVLNLHGDAGVIINGGGGQSGGPVEIYSDQGVNISSLTSVSIKSLVSTTIATDGTLSASAEGMVSIGAGGTLKLGAVGPTYVSGLTLNLNSPYLPRPPTPATPTATNSLPDVTYSGQRWVYTPGAVQSVCTVAPAHEPWIDPATGDRPEPQTPSGGFGVAGAALSVGASAAGKLF